MKKLILATLVLGTFATSASFAAVKTRKVSKKQTTSSESQDSAPLKKQFDSLGDNKVFVDRVQNMESDRKVRIVQNRIVDLNNRLEIGGNYAAVGGGDSYINTTNLGAMLDYHINPSWSIGARYQHFYNSLTSEGRAQYDRAQAAQHADPNSSVQFVKIDSPQDAGMVTVSYYPIYGKLNLFDAGIAHFDVYTLAGYGQIRLKSSTGENTSSDLITAGGGLAVWLSQHFATRLEVRYQTYKDLINTENRRENTIQGMASISVLL